MIEHVVVPLTPDARVGGITDGLRALPPASADAVAELRPILEAPYLDAPDRLRRTGVTVTEVDAGGVAALLVEPASGPVAGTLIGLHGGGYVVCSARTHLERFAAIGLGAGWRTLVVDYRLAPEHPYPAALDDATAALAWAAERFDGARALVGDSAGGGLALATVLRARDDEGPTIDGAVVISPWADLRLAAPSHATRRARDPFAHLDDLPAYAAMYAGDASLDDHALSPVHADFRGVRSLLVQIGSEETLYDDAVAVATTASDHGVVVRLEEWEGMFHTWHGYGGQLTGADDALAAASRYLRSLTSAT